MLTYVYKGQKNTGYHSLHMKSLFSDLFVTTDMLSLFASNGTFIWKNFNGKNISAFQLHLGEKLFDINGGSPLLHKALNQIINVLQAGAILKSQMISPQVLHAKQLQNQSSVFKCF